MAKSHSEKLQLVLDHVPQTEIERAERKSWYTRSAQIGRQFIDEFQRGNFTRKDEDG